MHSPTHMSRKDILSHSLNMHTTTSQASLLTSTFYSKMKSRYFRDNHSPSSVVLRDSCSDQSKRVLLKSAKAQMLAFPQCMKKSFSCQKQMVLGIIKNKVYCSKIGDISSKSNGNLRTVQQHYILSKFKQIKDQKQDNLKLRHKQVQAASLNCRQKIKMNWVCQSPTSSAQTDYESESVY